MTPMKIRFLIMACGVLSIACVASRGESGTLEDSAIIERPELHTDEAGLWMTFDKMEEKLKTSGNRVVDPQLNQYVRNIVCKLAASHCPDIRIYVMRVPHVNAIMAPNGMMQVWTGLILRAQNEAQLAHVLGHEIAHYLRRHSIQLWRDAQKKSSLMGVFAVPLVAASVVPGVLRLVDKGVTGSLLSFSRDNEREADDVGFELMINAGYDPREAPRILKPLMKKHAEFKTQLGTIFFATHPPTEERIETLTAKAQEMTSQGKQFFVGKEEFESAVAPLRGSFLRDELRLGEFKETQMLLDTLMEGGTGLGQLHFFQGELHRLRAGPGDREKAIVAYKKALQFPDAPPETYQALGLYYFKAGDSPKARAALERYLALQPDADDRIMIRAYIDKLE